MAELLMPKLSDTMEEGTVLRWLHADGEEVARGEPLVEIETDKANMVVDAPEGGRLAITAQEGDTLPVGAPIGAIGDGARPSAAASPAGDAAQAGPADADDHGAGAVSTGIPVSDDGTGAEIGMEVGEAAPGVQGSPREPVAPAAALAAEDRDAPIPPPAPAPPTAGGRVKASPLARRMAVALGVDLALVRGTGPDGRVVRDDVQAAARGEAAALREPPPGPAAPGLEPAAPAPAPPPRAPGSRTPMTRLQRTIARRMVEAKQAPHFYLERDVDATAAQALRRDLAEAAPPDARPSLNDLVLRAVALAAAERPDVASRIEDDALVAPARIDVGVAVAVERGLLVPVVRDVPALSVGRIAATVRDLATRCRDGSITPPELEGGVITVSNLGMYGVDRFAAIINPPEAAILAVGRARPVPVASDGAVVVREVMTLTLSVDHRVVYGAEGATFLGRVAELLERPHALVL